LKRIDITIILRIAGHPRDYNYLEKNQQTLLIGVWWAVSEKDISG
jgi:hypothetical protein